MLWLAHGSDQAHRDAIAVVRVDRDTDADVRSAAMARACPPRASSWAVAAMALVASLTSCAKPRPPEITPSKAEVTKLDLAGVDLRVTFDTFNPNAFDLSVQRVTAHVVADAKEDLGVVTSTEPFTLPAGKHLQMLVPLTMKWQSAGTLAALTASGRPIPYTVDGTAAVGGERLNVDVPFTVQGTLTQEQLERAAVRSLETLPGLLPSRAPR
jgi:LEA14-like dessication related protein